MASLLTRIAYMQLTLPQGPGEPPSRLWYGWLETVGENIKGSQRVKDGSEPFFLLSPANGPLSRATPAFETSMWMYAVADVYAWPVPWWYMSVPPPAELDILIEKL